VRGITPSCDRSLAWSRQTADDFLRRCQVSPAQNRSDSVFRGAALERPFLPSCSGSDNSFYLCNQRHTTRAWMTMRKVHRALTSRSRLCRSGQPSPESYRPRARRRILETIAVIGALLLASFDAGKADGLLYLRCNLSGTELSEGQSKPYSDTVVFKVNLQTNEGWETHPDHLPHHKRRVAVEIDQNAIRLSRGDEGDARSSDTSYRIDRNDGSVVFSHRVTWYGIQMGDDDSLTHAIGTCVKTPGPLPFRAQLDSNS
jgi:hypothetical protein